MLDDITQFGIKPKKYKDRPSAYAVILNDKKQLLTLKVKGVFHLPGGGIDSGENPKAAVVRETQEEAGCKITDLQYLGKANQFFIKTTIGSLNKLGIFYKARMMQIDTSKKIEANHEVCWITPDEFLNSSSGDFQKWAVKKALK